MSIADEQRVSASGATTAQSASQPDAYSPQVIRKLNALTSDFYAREAASFSATRQAPWHGWEKAWELITAPDAAQGPFPSHAAVRDSLSSRAARIPDDYASNSKDSLAVLDLGCGNLRFERFLAERTNAPPCASPPSTTAPIWHLPKSALYLPPSRTAFAAPLLLPKRKRRMLQGRARIPPKRPS